MGARVVVGRRGAGPQTGPQGAAMSEGGCCSVVHGRGDVWVLQIVCGCLLGLGGEVRATQGLFVMVL